MTSTEKLRPVVLCILDGWGYLPNGASNSITQAKTPNWTRLVESSPHGILEASEHYVGLPDGQMGNSEVGHMNLGAGRVVLQDLPRIDEAVRNGTLKDNATLRAFIARLKETGGAAHVMGLMSPGGVHAHQRHIAGLARAVAAGGVPVKVHAFLDGRDTPPKSAAGYLETFLQDIEGQDGIEIATVAGRFFAMDRDNRWDRIEAAYKALVEAEGDKAPDAVGAVEAAYAAGKTDEFVPPAVIGDYAGMKDGDGVLMGNFRSDRAREILTALLDAKFDKFERAHVVTFASALGMVEYSTELNKLVGAIFGPESLEETYGEVVARAGLRQLRIAETEKYAHVTFFFNGGREEVFDGEARILVPSPKVQTYDLKPEMSAYEVTDKLVEAIESGRFDAVVVNYANADMVGHSGKIEAAKLAVQAVDTCLGRVSAAVAKAGGVMLVTADHGNVEQMTDPKTGQPHTAHTTNPVPLLVVNAPAWVKGVRAGGKLADIAPTLLQLLGLPKPEAMTGTSLLVADGRAPA